MRGAASGRGEAGPGPTVAVLAGAQRAQVGRLGVEQAAARGEPYRGDGSKEKPGLDRGGVFAWPDRGPPKKSHGGPLWALGSGFKVMAPGW